MEVDYNFIEKEHHPSFRGKPHQSKAQILEHRVHVSEKFNVRQEQEEEHVVSKVAVESVTHSPTQLHVETGHAVFGTPSPSRIPVHGVVKVTVGPKSTEDFTRPGEEREELTFGPHDKYRENESEPTHVVRKGEPISKDGYPVGKKAEEGKSVPEKVKEIVSDLKEKSKHKVVEPIEEKIIEPFRENMTRMQVNRTGEEQKLVPLVSPLGLNETIIGKTLMVPFQQISWNEMDPVYLFGIGLLTWMIVLERKIRKRRKKLRIFVGDASVEISRMQMFVEESDKEKIKDRMYQCFKMRRYIHNQYQLLKFMPTIFMTLRTLQSFGFGNFLVDSIGLLITLIFALYYNV